MLDLVATETKPTTWRDRVSAELAAVWDKGLPFLLGGATVGGLAAANGGYFPPAWGWSSLALLWVVAAAIVVSRRPVLERIDLALIAGLLALLGWTSLSVVWSGTATSTVWETERLIVYVAAAAAALLILRKRSVPFFLGGMLLGITAAASYGLATRLYPDRFVSTDRFAGYRLAEPLGYWNAVGIFAALGLLLALGLAARAQRPIWRALAGASVAILAPTFFFTFSRGAWVALAIGLIAAVALDARRLQLVTTLFALAPAAVLTVWLGSRQEALTTVDAPLAAATREGHRLATLRRDPGGGDGRPRLRARLRGALRPRLPQCASRLRWRARRRSRPRPRRRVRALRKPADARARRLAPDPHAARPDDRATSRSGSSASPRTAESSSAGRRSTTSRRIRSSAPAPGRSSGTGTSIARSRSRSAMPTPSTSRRSASSERSGSGSSSSSSRCRSSRWSGAAVPRSSRPRSARTSRTSSMQASTGTGR